MDRPDLFVFVTHSKAIEVADSLMSSPDAIERRIAEYIHEIAEPHIGGAHKPRPTVLLGKALFDLKVSEPPQNPTAAVFRRWASDFIMQLLGELREVVCGKGKKRFKPLSKSTNAVVSSLAAYIVKLLGISHPIAVGIAVLVLLSLSQAVKKAFCKMTDADVLQALRRST